MLKTLMRMLESRADRAGRFEAVEPTSAPPDRPRHEPADDRDRRLAPPGSPQDDLDRSLSGKVLGGWLQNQHQTLVPLTLRLNRLDVAQISTLMRFAAVAFLSGTEVDDRKRAAMVTWVRSIGGEGDALRVFEGALGHPDALSALISEVHAAGIAPHAYASAVVAADQRELSGRLFANYIAARLGLSADTVRSMDRRYRR